MKRSFVVFVWVVGAFLTLASASALSFDIQSLPLLSPGNFEYLGAFRLPAEMSLGDSFDYGGGPMAYYAAGNSLFIGSAGHRIAEVTIPPPVISFDVSALPFAQYIQPFADPTEGHYSELDSNVVLSGLMVSGNRLIGSASIYYDANNVQRVSHFAHSLSLSQSSFSGWSQVWETAKSGFVSGMMSDVPAEWRASLGGPAATGQCCTPISWRTSNGPAAFAFDPSLVGQPNVAATPLLFYPADHSTLGPWSGSSPTYGATTLMGGMAIIAGTRTALYVGSNGTGQHCYGNGTGDTSLVGTFAPDGAIYCYDPTASDKGSHAYPYRYQVWAYDLNDFAAVRAGVKQPWDVVPYGVWALEFPFPEAKFHIGGVAYDASRQILYVSQLRADQATYAYRPLIHAFKVNAAVSNGSSVIGIAPPAVPVTPSTPPRTTSVTISSNKSAPQPPGTTIAWTAVPVGGAAPHQYQWWVFDGSNWAAATNWTSSSTFAWSPSVGNSGYRVGVWVRSNGITDNGDTSTESPFVISGTASAPPSAPVSSTVSAVSLSAGVSAPQSAGTTILWSATPTGGAAPHQYLWWIYDGSSWNQIGTWTSSSTFAWTPTIANSQYRVGVWVRSAGSAGSLEKSAESPFPITAAAAAPPPSSGSKTTALTLVANLVAPQPANTTITWNATPTGGVAPHQYLWWVYDGSYWNQVGTWISSSTFTWTPTIANSQYRVGVWVRSAGSTGSLETSAEWAFPIAAAVAPLPSLGGKTTAVTLAANLVAPQPANTTITWNATPSGGVAPHQYLWWVYDGSTWNQIGAWTSSATFAWTPTIANSQYRVGVWVRSAGSSGSQEVTGEWGFAITAAAATPPPAPPPSTSPSGASATSVTLIPNRAAPQNTGTTISWIAVPGGTTAEQQYMWWVFDGSNWIAAGTWTAASTFDWTPTTPNDRYRIGVWIRRMGTTGGAETSSEMGFPIGGSAAPPPSTTTTSWVTLIADLSSPQQAGTTITWRAFPNGGTAPHQYQWWLFDGSNWLPVTNWTTSSTYTWTPTTANSRYRIAVWVRSAGSTGGMEAGNESGFAISP